MRLTKRNELTEKGKTLKGNWGINKNHEITYRQKDQKENLRLKTQILEIQSNALVLTTTLKKDNGNIVTSIFKLTGKWQLDPKNRITFEVKKQSGKKDILTFKGTWKLGKNNQITYTYRKENLITKTKETSTLTFKGYWDISEKHRLTYTLQGNTDSVFRIRGTFQTKSILAKKGEIRYQLGIELKGKRKLKTITIFGKWKVSQDWGLYFEIKYEKRERKAILFGGHYNIDKYHRIQVELESKTGKPLGITLILTKDLLNKNGQAFLRLQRSQEEKRIEAGMSMKW